MALLTEQEFSCLKDREFLLTKQRIHEKVVALLATAEEQLKSQVDQSEFSFPQQTFLKAGKISRGEQYLGLPYWILDYPRKFSKEATFSFRTMIWWGHEISTTLHLAGKYKSQYQDKILNNLNNLKSENYYLNINESPWVYHFEDDNYLKVENFPNDLLEEVRKRSFLKLTQRVDFHSLPKLPDIASENFHKTLDHIGIIIDEK